MSKTKLLLIAFTIGLSVFSCSSAKHAKKSDAANANASKNVVDTTHAPQPVPQPVPTEQAPRPRAN